jgi:hypothetical protein
VSEHSIYDCAGCDEPITYGEDGSLWCDHPLGMCVLKVHKNQDCARRALERNPEHRLRHGNAPPESKKEKMERELERKPAGTP